MFGYQVIEHDRKIKSKIASLEKTVLDYLYWNTRISSIDDFGGLRVFQANSAGEPIFVF